MKKSHLADLVAWGIHFFPEKESIQLLIPYPDARNLIYVLNIVNVLD